MSNNHKSAHQEVEDANDQADTSSSQVHIRVGAEAEEAEVQALILFTPILVVFLEEFEHAFDHDPHVEQDLEPYAEQEQHEGVMVLDPNAVVDPWAVMVEPLNTLVADGTMS